MNTLDTEVVRVDLYGSSSSKELSLIQHIQKQVKLTIENSKNVPGLQAEEFNQIKPRIIEYWDVLVEKGVLEVSGTDQEVRPCFVALQGIVEHVLAVELDDNVKSLIGVIHTPMPATPLCTKGDISLELVDASIMNDPLRLFTVKARTTIIRDYLSKKGAKLYILYPENGKAKRTENERKIYDSEVEKYSPNLVDCPLSCESIANDLIGAFYLFKGTEEKKTFAFAIKATQAKQQQTEDPQNTHSFCLWFGEMGKSSVDDRVFDIIYRVIEYSKQPIDLKL